MDETRARKKMVVLGLDFEWDEQEGISYIAGGRVVSAWTESTMAGIWSGLHRMVGTERFNLALQGGGRDGVDGDWAFISSFPTFEEGFHGLIKIAAIAGWGRWELVSVDRDTRLAVVRIHNSWEASTQMALHVDWGSAYVGGKLAGLFQRHFGVPTCWAEQTRFIVRGDAYDEFEVRPTDETFEQRMNALVASDQATRTDLAVALARVNKEIEERDRTERDLREKLEVIARQEEAIKALETPIIEVWEGVVTLPMVGVMDSQRAATTMERLLAAISQKGATTAILDLTGVEIIDTSTADHIGRIAKAAELLGAQCIITGIRPAVAQTMVQIGIDLTKVITLSTLREALLRAMRGAPAARATRP
jgi:rsbT co-antagonist protein RsbR